MVERKRRRRPAKKDTTSLSKQVESSAEKEVEQKYDGIGPDPKTITPDRLIPSGVTLLNCACSDNPKGAFAKGSINTIPGKSASGKTVLMLNMLAQCASTKELDDYDLLLDDSEEAQSFDLDYLFPVLVGRLKAPRYDGELPVHSNTIEDFEGNMLLRCESGKPFIYVLDSLDSLSSTAELDREYKNAIKNAKTSDEKEKAKQSYGTEKARIISQTLRMINGEIKNSDSALFIVQQTKQNLNKIFKYQPDWITSGGEAPFFYSFHRIYTNSIKSHKGESKGIKHTIGGVTQAQVIKNKLNGKKRIVEFDIYEDLGIDDLAANIDFLKKVKRIKMSGAYMKFPDILGIEKMYRSDLIKYIEKENLESTIQDMVGEEWNEIERDIRLSDRKRRFG
jgi:RecA/RadA recombinase